MEIAPALRKNGLGVMPFVVSLFLALNTAQAATVVEVGASNTFGKGVARSQAYPAQLEAVLRAQGCKVRVINAGLNGETTGEMLQRLDRTVPKGASVVVLQPLSNDCYNHQNRPAITGQQMAVDATNDIQPCGKIPAEMRWRTTERRKDSKAQMLAWAQFGFSSAGPVGAGLRMPALVRAALT